MLSSIVLLDKILRSTIYRRQKLKGWYLMEYGSHFNQNYHRMFDYRP